MNKEKVTLIEKALEKAKINSIQLYSCMKNLNKVVQDITKHSSGNPNVDSDIFADRDVYEDVDFPEFIVNVNNFLKSLPEKKLSIDIRIKCLEVINVLDQFISNCLQNSSIVSIDKSLTRIENMCKSFQTLNVSKKYAKDVNNNTPDNKQIKSLRNNLKKYISSNEFQEREGKRTAKINKLKARKIQQAKPNNGFAEM